MAVIDASVWVSYYRKENKFHEYAKNIFLSLDSNQEKIFIPAIAFTEAAGVIKRSTQDSADAGKVVRNMKSMRPEVLIEFGELEFCSYLLPEFVFTGHEICRGGQVELPVKHRDYFDLILNNADLFPGFYHIDLANNVLPKLSMLRQFGFYPEAVEPESCGAHSPGKDFATSGRTA